MIAVGVLLALLCVAAWTDFRSHTIYNWNCYPGIVGGLLLNSAGLGLSEPGYDGLWFAAIGFLSCGMIMLTAFVFFQMGGGDVKLVAMIGSFLGWQAVPVVFILAALIAMASVLFFLVIGFRYRIPFGPYLSLGALLLVLFWQSIWPTAEFYIVMFGVMLPFIAVFAAVALAVCLFMMQGVKWLLGIPLYPPPEYDYIEVWESADQLIYQSFENRGLPSGQLKSNSQTTWPGQMAGQGQLNEHQWKNGCQPPGRNLR